MATFKRGDVVRKKTGSEWQGKIVGEYSTELTQEGYAIESDAHAGSVQIYPVQALEPVMIYDDYFCNICGQYCDDEMDCGKCPECCGN